ncbi:MAG: hypothetical protein FWF78_00430, partial [Defluviitaleaceae bacterium]|nr:hypothetical protein [Defluviitaleaceae bacterium]
MSQKQDDLKIRNVALGITAADQETDIGGGLSQMPLAEIGVTDTTGIFQKRGLSAADVILPDGASVQARLGAIMQLQQEVNDHMNDITGSEAGVHGGRFNMETENFEFFNPVYGDFQPITDGAPPTPQQIRTYGVQIDTTNSNPYTSVTYTGQAIGMVGGSNMWDSMPIFRDIRPCLVLNGSVVGYLNPNNYAQWSPTQDLTGLPATPDITSGNAGDVMIEIPRVGWRISTIGNILNVEITNDPNGGLQNFRYYAHTRVTEGDRNMLYVGAYKGFILNNRLRSLSGRTPSVSITIGNLRTAARANGAGYDQQMFFSVMLLQILYLIRFKNLNSQAALGQGVTTSGTPNVVNTGGTNTRSMNWGSQNTREQVKCLGIEDLWGNIWERVEGCFLDANFNLLTAFQGFNDTGAGYINRGSTGSTATVSAFIRRV